MPSKRSLAKSSSVTKPQVRVNSKAPTASRRNGKTSTSSHHLVLDLSLPSHIISDRSLFTSYTSSRKLHRTVFGNDIVIEGYGDVHIRTFAGTKSIVFRLRDCWHVPSSPHHFLSCKRVISQGKQVMLAGRTPRMIFSHNDRLAESQSPKYVPFARDGENFVLNFQISVEVSGVQPTVAPLFKLSLHAASFRPFAGMADLSLNPHDPLLSTATRTSAHDAISLHAPSHPPLADQPDLSSNQFLFPSLTHQQVLSPRPSASGAVTAAGVCWRSTDVVLSADSDIVVHGGADMLVGVDTDACNGFPLNDDADVMSHGGADIQTMPPVDVKVFNDVKDQVVRLVPDTFEGDPTSIDRARTDSSSLETPDSSLDSPDIADATTLRAPSTRTHHYFSCTLPLISTLNTDTPYFPCSLLSFSLLSSVPSFSALILSGSFSFPDSVLRLHANFSPNIRVEDSFILRSSTPFSPCISSLTSTLNFSDTTCLLYSSRALSFSYNNFPLHFSPLLSFSTFNLSLSSVYLHFEVSSLSPINFPLNSSHLLPSRLNSESWMTNHNAFGQTAKTWTRNTSGGCAFAIYPFPSPFRTIPVIPNVIPGPLARCHTGAVLDTVWTLHNDLDFIVASGRHGEDTSEIGQVLFHPTASSVLANSTVPIPQYLCGLPSRWNPHPCNHWRTILEMSPSNFPDPSILQVS